MSLANEILTAPPAWELGASAAGLAKIPMLVIAAEVNGNAAESAALAAKVRGAGGRIESIAMATDHSFSDHRIALAGAVVTWLQALSR